VVVEIAEKISSVRTMWILYVGLFFSTVTFKLLSAAGLIYFLKIIIKDLKGNMKIIFPLHHSWEDPFIELLEFAVLGVLCGLYGAMFVKFMTGYQRLKSKYSLLKT